MLTNKTSPGIINQSTKSNRMKLIFVLLCIISFLLYANTTFNWKLFHTIITNSLIIIRYPSKNVTLNSTKISFEEQIPLFSNRRFAIFSCSIHSKIHAYTFYTPITAASWNRVGYETIVVFVGDFTLPNVLTLHLNLTRTYLKHLGAYIIDIQCNSSYAIKLSQIVRVFGGFLPDSIIDDNDDILTGDSDLMPLRFKEYLPTNRTDGFIFNAFCCGSFKRRGRSYRMFPMGHIYMKKKAWRAIIMESKQRSELLVNADNQTRYLLSENASISFDTISLYARHEFKNIYDSNMRKGDSAWYMDQVLCSMLLTDYREKYKDFKIHERGRAARLDRASRIQYWNRDKFDQFGDAHLFHDMILQERNWIIFNKLLKALFNQTLVNLFNDYYRQYVIIVNTTLLTPKGRR